MSGRFDEKLNLTLNRQVWKDILLGCCPNSLKKKKKTEKKRENTQVFALVAISIWRGRSDRAYVM